MTLIIVIPARYHSKRFPGKPLAKIAGETLLQRTCTCAQRAVSHIPNAKVLVATEDPRILAHCQQIGVSVKSTPAACLTGTDRVWAAVNQLPTLPEIIINLQGDAPFTPPHFIKTLVDKLLATPEAMVATPVIPLSWAALDTLRQAKQTSPFSGTTAILDQQGKARWFSKTIIPAIRDEHCRRQQDPYSPVYLHVGLYAYRRDMLATYVKLAQTPYEKLEGLEQLRLIEHGYPVHTVCVHARDKNSLSGIDTAEDAARASLWIQAQQEKAS